MLGRIISLKMHDRWDSDEWPPARKSQKKSLKASSWRFADDVLLAEVLLHFSTGSYPGGSVGALIIIIIILFFKSQRRSVSGSTIMLPLRLGSSHTSSFLQERKCEFLFRAK